jgi:arylsulfatase
MKHPLTLFALVCGLALHVRAAPRPNILILLVDDQGYGDFSCHGNPILKTPNLDRLHDECIRFTDFHVAPMCSPTRGQLMSGMDALRNGATSVTAGRSFVRPGIPTMPEIFAGFGYRTGIFGKWHLGDNYPHRPIDKGFQDAVWLKGWGLTSAPEFTNTHFDGRCYRGVTETHFKGYITDFCFDEAMKWMRERAAKKEPFLCYLPLNAVHAPLVVAEKYSVPYQGKVGPKVAKFFGMIANVDENVARLESFLRETGLRDDTILIFMTDNGGTAGVKTFNAGLRGQKTEYYEGGHRVPCWVRWPAGKLRPPGDLDMPTQIQDLLPTLVGLAGTRSQLDFKSRVDGISLAGLLQGSTNPLPDRLLVVQYGQIPRKWDSCVIWNQWRLVKGEELYDVHADRAQEHDVATQHKDVVEKMRAQYEKWWASIEPRLNDFVTISLGAEQANPVQLTSSDWEAVWADNSGHIDRGAGGPRGGPWNVFVEREGEYEISLRRWPPDLDLPLAATRGKDGKALPIRAARLAIGDQSLSLKSDANAKVAVFHARLPRGKTQLRAWFQDETGHDLCGAYYATVTRQ